MRLVSYERGGALGTGVWVDNVLHGVERGADGFPGSVDELLAAGADLAVVGRKLVAAPEVETGTIRFLPPVHRPSKILCVGLNYKAHSAETGLGEPDYPAIFARFASTLVGHGSAITKPAISDQLDYEGELVAIIGRTCKRVGTNEALGHVAGYSIFNEASIRDYQLRTSQWTMGKNFDATGGFGPSLVTPDELPPGGDGLRLITRLNGQVMQDGNTADMVFKVANLVSILSQVMTLEPGDIIVTGTPSGVGFSRKPPVFMKPGDTCEVEIEGIGTLRNPIIAG
ncbi:MAG TPA: fumarylacetoacetate hydrolase family protein [bacterium]|nr:fumarylacetoacetate hydrolase family protein [bacterium]